MDPGFFGGKEGEGGGSSYNVGLYQKGKIS